MRYMMKHSVGDDEHVQSEMMNTSSLTECTMRCMMKHSVRDDEHVQSE